MRTPYDADQVVVREVARTRVAIFEYRGDRRTIDATIQRFIAWGKGAGLSPRTRPTFNVWHSERNPVDLADYRMDLCVDLADYRMDLCVGIAGDHAIDPDDRNVPIGEIPGGRCAVLRVTGDTHDLEPAARSLYRDWLPAGGGAMRDFPIYCERFFLDTPELRTAADLFLPLR